MTYDREATTGEADAFRAGQAHAQERINLALTHLRAELDRGGLRDTTRVRAAYRILGGVGAAEAAEAVQQAPRPARGYTAAECEVPRDGLTPLRAAGPAVLKLTGSENDPVAVSRTRYRLVWDAIAKQAAPAERVGGRWFIRERDLGALAVALGVSQPPQETLAEASARKQAEYEAQRAVANAAALARYNLMAAVIYAEQVSA